MDTGTQKMLASKRATAARRAQQDLRVRELKISRLSSLQGERLERIFLEAKWLRNSIVATGIFEYSLKEHGVHVRLPDGSLESRQLTILPAHVKQTIQLNLQAAVKSLANAKRAGRIAGAIRFTDRVNSIEFKTGDVKVKNSKVLVPKVGWVQVRGFRQLGEEIANVRLVRKVSGYYLKVASLTAKQKDTSPQNEPIGLDFGIKTHITTSDGNEWNLTVEEPERLKRLQRKLQRQTKGSNNYEKTRSLIQRSYERMDHLKDEAANQFVASLKGHSLVAFQDENLRGWKAQRGYGRAIQHSAMGRVKAKLQQLPQAVMLDRFVPTTQYCPYCGNLNRIALNERQYSCDCGYSEQRDIHAARNMLLFADIYTHSPVERGSVPVEEKVSADSEDKTLGLVSHTLSKQEAAKSSILL